MNVNYQLEVGTKSKRLTFDKHVHLMIHSNSLYSFVFFALLSNFVLIDLTSTSNCKCLNAMVDTNATYLKIGSRSPIF